MNFQQAALAVFVGAVIGYVTNWIAIRMLFRPRREVHVLGKHVPFTPGVIPRGKKRLAGNVGEVVGGMLLTGENVTRHLLQPGVEARVRERVNHRLAELVEQGATLGELLGGKNGSGDAGIPGEEAQPGLAGPGEGLLRDDAARMLAGAARGVLGSDELRRPLARLAAGAVYGLLDRPVGRVVGSPEFAAFRDALGRLPAGILAREEVDRGLREELARRIECFLNSPEPVGSYLPAAVREGLHQFISDQTPRVAAALEQYLDSPGVRRAIKNRIDDFFEGTALKRLINGMFQLAGSGSDAIVRRLAREISAFLADERNRAELEERLHILLDEALAKSVAETTASLDAAARRQKAEEFAAWVLEKLRRPETMEPLLDALEELLAAGSGRSWRELFRLDDLGLAQNLEDYLDRLLADLARDEEGQKSLPRLAERLVDGLWNMPVGRALEVLSPEAGADPGEPVLRLYRYAVREHVPALLQFFDVNSMVRRQVEELDVLQVEGMVLGIVRRELVAITWLGALLGAILGAGMVGMQYLLK